MTVEKCTGTEKLNESQSADRFDPLEAFSRNIGWLTEQELKDLSTKRIAIAGLGGVGGSHLLTLSRLGIGGFNISDLDIFEMANFNRQAGASISHLGRPKVDVLAEMALDINPNLSINRFPNGVNAENLDSFLDNVDVYVDGLDFFAVEAREQVFAACYAKGIPAVTAAPLGWGSSLLVFIPGKMSFEDYFQMKGRRVEEKALRFFVGLSPESLQQHALVDPTRLNVKRRIGPSTPVACEMCASFAAATAIKLLVGRGSVEAAPTSIHFDAFSMKMKVITLPKGMEEPSLQSTLSMYIYASGI